MTKKLGMPYDRGMDAKTVIRRLGGTSAAARLCEIKPPSVSEWIAKNKIPKAQEKFLRAVRPDAFVPESDGQRAA